MKSENKRDKDLEMLIFAPMGFAMMVIPMLVMSYVNKVSSKAHPKDVASVVIDGKTEVFKEKVTHTEKSPAQKSAEKRVASCETYMLLKGDPLGFLACENILGE